MTYVGDEGVYAAWYAAYHGVFPEIAWIKSGYGDEVKGMFGELAVQGRVKIPKETYKELITFLETHMPDMDAKDKAELMGFDKKQTYYEYRARVRKGKLG